jgi:hypothetical protein
VKQLNVTQDGRSAFLALPTRGEGEAAVDVRRAAAEEIIQTARYTGTSKCFSIGNYINLFQGAFTELESIGEGEYALTKKQKLSIFTKGHVVEEYEATKHSIYQNEEETRSDFQKCYAFVETMDQFKASYANTSSFDRNLSETGSRKGSTRYTVLQLSGQPFPMRKRTRSLSARGSKKSGDGKGNKG